VRERSERRARRRGERKERRGEGERRRQKERRIYHSQKLKNLLGDQQALLKNKNYNNGQIKFPTILFESSCSLQLEYSKISKFESAKIGKFQNSIISK
jgi:hypothetical protein